ncbi:MAG: transcription termination/antitermination factor NusG [Clostridiales bacterium]|nr:transcription termination/antitermination factor NusG [Clostridiales bacterium]
MADEMSANNEAKWYVVHTYSGYENKVKTILEKTIAKRNMQDIIQEIAVPTEDVVEIKDGKKKVVARKKYPGYVFVKFVSNFETLKADEEPSTADKELWYLIRNTRGVTGFVSTNPNKPLPITDSDLASMGIATDWVPDVDYDIGDTIRVISGPFADSICVVEEMNYEKQQVKVKLSMFGRETPVYLDFTQVERI